MLSVREALVGDALGSQWQAEPRDGLPGLDDDIEAWTIRPSQPADA